MNSGTAAGWAILRGGENVRTGPSTESILSKAEGLRTGNAGATLTVAQYFMGQGQSRIEKYASVELI